jgi:tyrosine-protein phosphatase YwqE
LANDKIPIIAHPERYLITEKNISFVENLINKGALMQINVNSLTVCYGKTAEKIAKKLLKNNGVIAIVHRPERLVEIIGEMKKNNIEPKRVQFVYPKKNMEANIMLIEGSKNGKPGLKILPPIYSHQDNGEYTSDVKKYFE